MKRRKKATLVESDDEYEADNPEIVMSSELSSLSEASSGDDWVPPVVESQRKKFKRRTRSHCSGKFVSSDDDDDSDSYSVKKTSSKSKPRSKPKLSKLASIEKNNRPGKSKAQNDNGLSSTLIKNSENVAALKNEQNKTPNEQEKKAVEPKITIEPNKEMNKFKIGDFFILKSDLDDKNYSTLWKLDGKTLIVKYEHFVENGKELYKKTNKFSGWCSSIVSNYCPVKVTIIQFDRGMNIVKLNKDEIKQGG